MRTHRSVNGLNRLLLSIAVGSALIAGVLVIASTPARAEDVPPQPDVTTTAGLLGTCYANYATAGQDLGPLAYRAGSRWDRIDFSWSVLEPAATSGTSSPTTISPTGSLDTAST